MPYYLEELLRCSLPQSYGGKALRAGIVGASGTGKTSILRETAAAVVLAGKCRILAYSPYPGPIGRICRTAAEARQSLRRRQSTTVIQDPGLYLSLMPEVVARGSIMLLIDEAHELYPRSKPAPTMIKVLREGRNIGIGLIWADQRPTACNTALLGVSQSIIIGRLIGPADHAYSRAWGVIQPLPNHSFMGIFPSLDSPLKITSKKY